MAGETYGRGFPLTNYATSGRPILQTAKAGNTSDSDMFIAKLNPQGRLEGADEGGPGSSYSTYFGGVDNDKVAEIVLGEAGSVFLAGTSFSTGLFDRDANRAASQLCHGSRSGNSDAVVFGVDALGAKLTFATYLGGRGNGATANSGKNEEARALTRLPDGTLWVAGHTWSSDFPVQDGLHTRFHGESEAFLVALRQSSSPCVTFGTLLGGKGEDEIHGLAVDGEGGIVVTGRTMSDDMPLVEPIASPEPATTSNVDAFIARLDPSLREWTYVSPYVGRSWSQRGSRDIGTDVAIDASSGGAIFVGRTTAPYMGPDELPARGAQDGYLLVVNSRGELLYETGFGGSGEEDLVAVSVGSGRDAFIAGYARSLDLPAPAAPAKPPHQSVAGGSGDGFVSRISDLPWPTPTATATATATPIPTRTPTSTLTPVHTLTPTATSTPTPHSVHLPLVLRDRYCFPRQLYTDVVLLIDASRSMLNPESPGGRKKVDVAIESARIFIEGFFGHQTPNYDGRPQPEREDMIGLIMFNKAAYTRQVLTRDQARLLEELEFVRYTDEGSRIDIGINEAIEALFGPFGNTGRLKALVILSDGRVNPQYSEEVREAAAAANQRGVRIFTIGYGRDHDPEMLREISSEALGSGQFFFDSPDEQSLKDAYDRLRIVVPCPPHLYWPFPNPPKTLGPQP